MAKTRTILLGVVGILAAWVVLILVASFFWIGTGLGGGGLAVQPKWVQTTFSVILFLSGPLMVAVYLRRSFRKSTEEFVRQTENRIGKHGVHLREPRSPVTRKEPAQDLP
jgi:membrane protein implicated in regulation of membrane protease activity